MNRHRPALPVCINRTDRTDLGTIAERFRGRVLFQGSSFEKVHADHPQYRPDLALEDIAGGDPETLYLLST